jgi:hypothetical protein
VRVRIRGVKRSGNKAAQRAPGPHHIEGAQRGTVIRKDHSVELSVQKKRQWSCKKPESDRDSMRKGV